MVIAIAVLLFVIVLYTNLNRHFHLWHKAQKWPQTGERVPIDHDKEIVLRVVLMAPSAILFFNEALNGLSVLKVVPFLIALLALVIIVCSMIMFTFWFLFNGMFNNKRGFSWFFEGTIDKNESKSDDFLRGRPVWQKLLIQAGCSILFISLYIWFCLHW